MGALLRCLAVSALVAVAACSGSPDTSGRGGSSSPTSSDPVPVVRDLPPVTSLKEAKAKHIKVTGSVDWVVMAGGDAWAASGAPEVRRFDGKTGDPAGKVRLPDDVCSAMDAGFGSVWVTACASAVLVRIDERDGSVQANVKVGERILQEEGSVGAGEGAVWVLTVSPKPTLYKVDPRSDTVVDSYRAPDDSAAVRAGLGHVWITDTAHDLLVAIDPRSGDRAGKVKVGPGARFIAVGEGAVWVLNQSDGSVTQVDPTSLKAVRKIVVGEEPVEGGDIAVGGGFVWARVSDSLVAQIDPASGKVLARFGTPEGSGSVAADDRAVWITAHDVDSVWRVPLG
jgi:streptogramin lyase